MRALTTSVITNAIGLIFSIIYVNEFLPSLAESYSTSDYKAWQLYWILQSSIAIASTGVYSYLSVAFVENKSIFQRLNLYGKCVPTSLAIGIALYLLWYILIGAALTTTASNWIILLILIRTPLAAFTPILFSDTSQNLLKIHDYAFPIVSCAAIVALHNNPSIDINWLITAHGIGLIFITAAYFKMSGMVRITRIIVIRKLYRRKHLTKPTKRQLKYFILTLTALIPPFIETTYASRLKPEDFYTQTILQRYGFIIISFASFAGWMWLKHNIKKFDTELNERKQKTIKIFLGLLFSGILWALIATATHTQIDDLSLSSSFALQVATAAALATLGQAMFIYKANTNRLITVSAIQFILALLISIYPSQSMTTYYGAVGISNLILFIWILKGKW